MVTDGEVGPRLRPRNGPPLAVSTISCTRSASTTLPSMSLARRHWCTAQCSDCRPASRSAGGRRPTPAAPPGRRRSAIPCWPARGADPASSAASVTDRPAKPTTPLMTTSADVARPRPSHHRPPTSSSAGREAIGETRPQPGGVRHRHDRRDGTRLGLLGTTASTDRADAEGLHPIAIRFGRGRCRASGCRSIPVDPSTATDVVMGRRYPSNRICHGRRSTQPGTPTSSKRPT